MKLRPLFRAFDQLADLPGSVAQLRQFILEAGVSGKLIVQDENDEPARELLARFHNRAKSGNPRVAANDTVAQLPPGWELVNMGEVAEQRLGKMLDKAKNKGTPLPYLRNTNVQWMRFDLDDIKELRFEDREIEEFELRDGDLLVCEGGEPGRCAIWQNQRERMMFQKALHRLRPHPGVNARFLALRLRADALAGRLDSYFTGATIKHFTGKEICRYSFPLPPTAEQARIVAKVDELMALCDVLEARQTTRSEARRRLHAATLHHVTAARSPSELATHWSRLRTHFDPLHANPDSIPGLRKAILQLAIEGRLVKQDSHDVPGAQELELIRTKKSSLNLRKPTNYPAISESECPFALPQGWAWARWGEIADWITYGFTRPMPHVDVGLPIVTGKNVLDGVIDFTTSHMTTEAAFDALSEKDRPSAGDILLTKDGSIGRAAVVDTKKPFCINQSVAVLWLRSCHLDRRFLLAAIRSPWVQEPIWAKAEGAAIKHISVVDFAHILVPVPPLAEQKRIVAKVEQLLALCDELETRLKDADARRARLLTAAIKDLLGSTSN